MWFFTTLQIGGIWRNERCWNAEFRCWSFRFRKKDISLQQRRDTLNSVGNSAEKWPNFYKIPLSIRNWNGYWRASLTRIIFLWDIGILLYYVNDNQCTQCREFVHVARVPYPENKRGVQWSGCLSWEGIIGRCCCCRLSENGKNGTFWKQRVDFGNLHTSAMNARRWLVACTMNARRWLVACNRAVTVAGPLETRMP